MWRTLAFASGRLLLSGTVGLLVGVGVFVALGLVGIIARMYGLQSLKYARELAPFYRGYAYETLARAEMIVNNRVIMHTHLERAQTMLALIENEEEREMLAKDLESII